MRVKSIMTLDKTQLSTKIPNGQVGDEYNVHVQYSLTNTN